MESDCFSSRYVCGSCWVWAATVTDLSVDRMPFSGASIKRKVTSLAFSIRPMDGRGRPSPQFHLLSFLFPPPPWRTWQALRETFFLPASALLPHRRGRMPHLPGQTTGARDYGKHWTFCLSFAFQERRGQDARAPTVHPLPSRFPCSRSGFHAFQCRFLSPPSHSSPRRGLIPFPVALPPTSQPIVRNCRNCLTLWFSIRLVVLLFLFPKPSIKIFPTIRTFPVTGTIQNR